MRVDLKSFLLGAVLILALFIVSGQVSKPNEPIGRYQIVMPNSTGESPIPFLIDTKTGKNLKFYIDIESRSFGWTVVPMDSLTLRYFWGNY